MTFLELCQSLRSEAGIAGTGPAAVSAQSGMYAKLIGWVQEAYREILRMHPWGFLWVRGTVNLASGTAAYDGASWTLPLMGRVFARKMFIDGQRLRAVSWDTFDTLHAYSGRPTTVARRPDGKLVFHPTPDAAYELRVDYLKDNHALSDNGDVPLIPDASLHKIIVYKALQYYGLHDENVSAAQHGALQYAMLFGQMAERYLPRFDARPIALDVVEPESLHEVM